MCLSEARVRYIDRRVEEIYTQYSEETERRKAFSRSCGTKKERAAYCALDGIAGKEAEVILNTRKPGH